MECMGHTLDKAAFLSQVFSKTAAFKAVGLPCALSGLWKVTDGFGVYR